MHPMKLALACLLLNVAAVSVQAATEYQCGSEAGYQIIETHDGASSVVILHNSNNDALCTLTATNMNGELIPLGRSYDNKDWEVVAGPFVEKGLEFSCSSNKCTVDLSIVVGDAQNHQDFRLTSFASYLDSATEQQTIIARFLEQATFGTTLQDLHDWSYGTDFAAWIYNQINNVPLTSHREFFRERTNPRLDRVFGVGKTLDPCQKGARWRTTALTSKDKTDGKFISFSSVAGDGSAPYVLKIDGEVRTIVDNYTLEPEFINLHLDTDYEVCRNSWHAFWRESYGDQFRIKVNDDCYDLKDGIPLVDLSLVEVSLPNMIDLTGANLGPIDNVQFGSEYWESIGNNEEYILNEDFQDSQCEALPTPYSDEGLPNPTIYAKMTVDGVAQYVLYDARLDLVENTIQNPAHDGGGQTAVDTDNIVRCMNTPRTFLNEEHCFLSYDDNSCSPDVPAQNSIRMDEEFLKQIDDITGRYLFAFVDIPMDEDNLLSHTWTNRGRVYKRYHHGRLVCDPWAWKWVRFQQADDSNCDGDYMTVHNDTHALFQHLLRPEFDDAENPNPMIKQVYRRNSQRCHNDDREVINVGYINGVNGTCWKHVHPLEGNVYDMSDWMQNRDTGVIPDWFDISEWATEPSGAVLSVPAEHGNEFMYGQIHKYRRNKYKLLYGQLGDVVPFRNLPRNLRTEAVDDAFGETIANEAGQGVVICGSLGEVANKPELGNHFEVVSSHRFDWRYDTNTLQNHQKSTVWSYLALTAEDQLRQRVAWALSQILVIAPATLGDHWNTEASLQYYDIFVRNAFGNYRDILKQVSFSEKMGRMLSSINNRAYQYSKDRGREAFPDENYAREIMQLFSIGITQLNMDGTEIVGSDGEPLVTYDTDDLMSYSRVWTGIERQNWRGNNDGRSSRVDPLTIRPEWHDYFPKNDLMGGYLGEKNYPLCIDLPDKHFVKKKAVYRLLGSRNRPELVQDPHWWEKGKQRWERIAFCFCAFQISLTLTMLLAFQWPLLEPALLRMELSTDSPLYSKLCEADSNGSCTFPGKVTLDENLAYPHNDFVELGADTLRTVKVQSGSRSIYYEYIRQPCVEHSFFPDATKVEDSLRGRERYAHSSLCADPRCDVAAESCCRTDGAGWQNTANTWWHGYKNCLYSGERMTKSTAETRCSDIGANYEQCSAIYFRSDLVGLCGLDIWRNIYFSWTNRECRLQVRINDRNLIALVHDVDPDLAGETRMWDGVDPDTGNFFKAAWIKEMPSNCTTVAGCTETENGCICDTTLEEKPAFTGIPFSVETVKDACYVGAPDPAGFDSEVYSTLDCGGVTVHAKQGDCSNLNTDAIFEVVDVFGAKRFLKNLVSTVSIGGQYSFRNPVQFINFADPELRDMNYEMEAALDSYFYHPTHPPFLAHLMLQRFGHSNPSPNFIQEVAEAYRQGSYNGIGSGDYGDLGAMIAAILLYSESTSVALTADPTYGQLREPLVKIVAFLRNMGYSHDSPLTVPFLSSLYGDIGQGPYEHPGVFNFFLPEFMPNGAIGSAGLVSPETQILNGKRLTDMLDGMMRLVKNGLDQCDGGFAAYRPLWCLWENGNTRRSYGSLMYSIDREDEDDIDAMLHEISMLLTSGRLSAEKLELIKIAVIDEFTYSDRRKAIRTMIELMITTAEFHTTNLASHSTERHDVRQATIDDVPSENEYKAVVFLMFAGGMDSWNLLVPKCDELYNDYFEVRGEQLALNKNELDDLDATGSGQPCDQFGVNKSFKIGKELYDIGEAIFLANTGVLEHPVDRTNYRTTGTKLFAHNWQQRETMKMDINKELGETGIGGRLLDELRRLGYKTSANTVDTQAVFSTGSPVDNNPVRQVTSGWSRDFNRRPTITHSTDRISMLNGDADRSTNSVYGETYSQRLMQALHENDELYRLSRMQEFQIDKFQQRETHLDRRFRAVAQYIKSHEHRNIDREVFVIQDGGYDMHNGDFLGNKLPMISNAIESFKAEMKAQGLWDNVVIVSGSDFGRTLVPNANGGTDHAWGGHGFIMGGGLKGGQILGKYPEDIIDGPYRIGNRGRMVPQTSLNSQWNALIQWMGVTDEDIIDSILPNHQNFDKCNLYTDQDLFSVGNVTTYCVDGVETGVDA